MTLPVVKLLAVVAWHWTPPCIPAAQDAPPFSPGTCTYPGSGPYSYAQISIGIAPITAAILAISSFLFRSI